MLLVSCWPHQDQRLNLAFPITWCSPQLEHLNLLVRTKFYLSWAGGQVHIVRTVGVCHQISFYIFHLLLMNQMGQILMWLYLNGSLAKLCSMTLLDIQDGCHGLWLVENWKSLENLLHQNPLRVPLYGNKRYSFLKKTKKKQYTGWNFLGWSP